jgi:phospholipase C
MNRRLLLASAFAVALSLASGCASHSASPLPYAAASADYRGASPDGAGRYIKHVVIVVQENRSFDNLFATFPHAHGTTHGLLPTGKIIALKKVSLLSRLTPYNTYAQFKGDYDNGKMDGFYNVGMYGRPGSYVYQYVDPNDIVPYWTLAKQYVLADNTFQTQGSGSFTAHQDLIRGDTAINANDSVVDNPSDSSGIWGCAAPSTTTTSLLTLGGGYLVDKGPRPCFTYATLRDTLDVAHVSWKYYTPMLGTGFDGNIWNAFAAIKSVYYGPEWQTNISSPQTNVLTDISNGQLPSVAWVIPDFANSDHPNAGSDTGPSWVATVVNALGKSQYWKSTAIVIVWDDWGGFYDHVRPPRPAKTTVSNLGGPGFRVPMIVVSPYAKRAYISHKQYEFGSIVKFVETVFGLPSLHTTDATTAGFVTDFFNFASPRSFTPVATKYSQAFFERQAPSNHPVDTE